MIPFAAWGLLAAVGFDAALPRCPAGWTVELVAQTPRLKHPSVVCCAPDGRVFVAEDPMDMGTDNSGKPTDRVLCFHPNGKVTTFAENLHAVFGLAYIDGKLYVHHCPKFSVFTDAGSVGKDRKDLIATTNPNPGPGFNDHIPSNVRLGMDGWLYMSVGDKGVFGAVGTDWSTAELRGGGVLRFRPDGSKLEVYCTGTRNHLDVAIDAEDEMFTYDNTDDGNGWWTRVTHMVDGGFYGYPWDYKPRRPYTLWMMADYGGGSPTGALAYNEDALPAAYRGNLFLCEWGRKQLLRLTAARDGGTFRIAAREDFLTAGAAEFRPVGIAVSPDGLSLYVTDWNFGGWKQNVSAGRLLKVTYTGGPSGAAAKPAWYIPAATGKPFEAATDELVKGLMHPAQCVRLAAQRRLAERGAAAIPPVKAILADTAAPAYARWSAIWALDAIDGGAAARTAIASALVDADPSVRRQAARQLGARAAADAVPLLANRLADADASVRFHAATALGRIGDKRAVAPLLRALAESDLYARFAAFTALNRIGRADPTAWPGIVAGLGNADAAVREGTAFALRNAHDEPLILALSEYARGAGNPSTGRAAALGALAELARREEPWDGKWWGTQPVKSPPPPKSREWAGTPGAVRAVRALVRDPDPAVRLAAAEAVVAVADHRATDELAAAFADSADAAFRRAALRSLAAAAPTAASTAAVAGVLAEPADRESLLPDAIAAAGRIGGPKMIAALIRFADSQSNPGHLTMALEQLGMLKATDAVPTASRHLNHSDEPVRTAAINALAKIGGEPSAAALLPLLADERPSVRRAAITALGEVRSRSAVEPLLKAYADHNTRADALTALAAIPDVYALDVYLDGLAGRDAAVRAACAAAIAAIRPTALPRIEARLDRSPPLSPAVVAELQRIYAVPVPVKAWKLIGPFADIAPPPFDPAAPDFTAEYPDARGKPARWMTVAGDRAGKVDLLRQGYSATERVVAYAAVEVESPTDTAVEMAAGCDDGLVVWVNGKKAFEQLGDRAYAADEFRFKAALRAGTNRIVAKSVQNGGNWEFALSVPPPGTGRLFQTAAAAADPAEYARYAAAATGDPTRGRAAFADAKGAGCIKCHADGSAGQPAGDIGPSLLGVGAKYDRKQLIEAVLFPSKQILDGYHQTQIVTADGRVMLGIVHGETATEVTLADADGKRIAVSKADIDERKELDRSLMPDGLHAGLTRQDFADLIAYLESLKQPAPPAAK